MTTVYFALGANVGDASAHITQAIELLGAQVHAIQRAPLYATKAFGYTDQPNFTNTAVSGTTELSPEELLTFVKGVEQQIGRTARFHWGPREIDIDIIFYGDTVLESQRLTIPHPGCRQRDFVLQPICDLAPDLIDPITHQSISQLLAAIPAAEKSVIS